VEYEWRELQFPQNSNIVYIIYAKKNDTKKAIYVGRSSRNIGRFGDYVSKQFSASTDFKVGTAIGYLQQNGFSVSIKYRNSKDIRGEEKKLLDKTKQEYGVLLNDMKNYKYKEATKDKQEDRIKEFVDKIIGQFK